MSYREQLAKELETLGKITEDAAKTYDAVDTDLANALRGRDKVPRRPNGVTRR